jgi:hypothetical protein
VVTGGLSAGAASYFGGAVTATSASAHTFGTTNTVSFTAGKIAQAAVTTEIFSSTGATTNGRWLRLTNTGADAYIGIESSAGGSLLTGATPYATVITSGAGVPVQIGTGDALRATFASTGTTFTGAVLSLSASNVSIPNNTATTVYALPSSGTYIVNTLLDVNSWGAYVIVGKNTTGSWQILGQGGNFTFSLSGSNLQITQASGATSSANETKLLKLG